VLLIRVLSLKPPHRGSLSSSLVLSYVPHRHPALARSSPLYASPLRIALPSWPSSYLFILC